MTGGLHGLAVLVTRPAAQAEPLCRRLVELGAEVFRLPTLALEPLPLDPSLRADLRWAVDADWVFFVSRNAVELGLAAFAACGLPAPSGRTAAVGPATAGALESHGLRVHLCPETGFDSEAVLADPGFDIAGRSLAIVCGIGGRELLGATAAQRGAEVRRVEVYRRVLPAVAAEPVLAAWTRAAAPVAVVTSRQGLANLIELTPAGYRAALRQAPLVCVSARIADAALEEGFRGPRLVAPAPDDDGIIQALLPIAHNDDNRNHHDRPHG